MSPVSKVVSSVAANARSSRNEAGPAALVIGGALLQADELLLVDRGQVRHHGACADPATHRALEEVFDSRIAVHQVAGQWAALPRQA